VVDIFKVSGLCLLKIRENLALKDFANAAKEFVEMKIRRQIDCAVALFL
jgi:hypothetical protein